MAAMPKIDGPSTRILPPLPRNIQTPMIMAMGMVLPMVKMPQALWLNALTTMMARPAMATIRIKSTAIMASRPVTGPTSRWTM